MIGDSNDEREVEKKGAELTDEDAGLTDHDEGKDD